MLNTKPYLNDKQHIFIRVDASHDIGHGHVMRCLTLAHGLSAHAEVTFICADLPGNLMELIEHHGFKVVCLLVEQTAGGLNGSAAEERCVDSTDGEFDETTYEQWLPWSQEEDSENTQACLLKLIERAGKQPDWLIVDHYALGKRWEQALQGLVKKIMVIDDLFDRSHICDLLLNQTPLPDETALNGNQQGDFISLIGSQYVLLRSEFLSRRDQVIERRQELTAVKNILLAPGGVDAKNFSLKILKLLELAELDGQISVDVVLGKHAPYIDVLQKYAFAQNRVIRIHSGVDTMSDFMWQADLAIGAAGGTSWERCVLGLPTLLLIYAENQKPNADVLLQHECVKLLAGINDMDDDRWINVIADACTNLDWLKRASQNAFSLCDGRGLERVLVEMGFVDGGTDV